MKYSLFLIAAIGFLGLGASFYRPLHRVAVPSDLAKPDELIVHEWGTFTSIAGKNGVAVDWLPLNGASDLPKFVYTVAGHDGLRGTYRQAGKGELARVRMETPVIYFYTKQRMDVSVKVGFPLGKITEWYPQASVVNGEYLPNKIGRAENGINWGSINLLPEDSPVFMREAADSHYYPARETDAVPLQVCDAERTRIEKERFLFYRGIGNFDLPVKVRVEDEKVILGTIEGNGDPARTVTNAILFENRGGQIGYQFVPLISGDTPVDRPRPGRSLSEVAEELERVLVGQGLYDKEARAMVETWKDSWFEEGLRVFYVLPRAVTDEILPLTISPAPARTVRVLVGRAEIITPEMEFEVRRLVALLTSACVCERDHAREELKRRGRFFAPILRNILETEKDAGARKQLQDLLTAGN